MRIPPAMTAPAARSGPGDALAPWVLGVLLLCGSALAVLSLPLTEEPVLTLERAGWILLLTVPGGAFLVRWPRRVPQRILHLVPAAGSAAICVLIAVADDPMAAAYTVMLSWPVTVSAFILPIRVTAATLAVGVAGFAAAILASGAPIAGAQIAMCGGALLVMTLVVTAIRWRSGGDRRAGGRCQHGQAQRSRQQTRVRCPALALPRGAAAETRQRPRDRPDRPRRLQGDERRLGPRDGR